jgi:hypothetical protein
MARIVEEVIVIKLSKLVKDTDNVETLASPEVVASIEQVAQQLVGDSVIVEAQTA